jgi:hypothetical protein
LSYFRLGRWGAWRHLQSLEPLVKSETTASRERVGCARLLELFRSDIVYLNDGVNANIDEEESGMVRVRE